MKTIVTLIILLCSSIGIAQKQEIVKNELYLEKLNKDSIYVNLRNKINQEYKNAKPIQWGEFVAGVDEDLITQKKL